MSATDDKHLSSAFDTIDMCTLLRHLRFTFGISDPALNWISVISGAPFTGCTCRTQTVVEISCEYGVPQGSVLGPLLFALFMSPISNGVSQLYICTSDSTTLWQSLHCCATLARP